MRQFLFLVLILSLTGCGKDDPSNGTGEWKQRSPFPGAGRAGEDGVAFALNDKGYFGLGANQEGYLGDFWTYDPRKDEWKQLRDFTYEWAIVTNVVIGDRPFVMGYSGTLYEYIPAEDSWKAKSAFPGGVRPGIASFSINGFGYFGTGNDTGPSFQSYSDFWKYDPSNDTWDRIADLPGPARTNAVSFSIGEYAYVGLGFHQGAPPVFKDLYRYDPRKDQWNQMADYPGYNSVVGMRFASGSRMYVSGPEAGERHWGIVYEFNPAKNAWREMKLFPSGNSISAAAFTVGSRMFVLCGWWSDYKNEVWEFCLNDGV